MQLYGMGMSRSFRALWAAEEVNADYQYIEVAFGSTEEGGTQSTSYKTLNSQGKVPTLVDGDLVIRESGAIINYLAAKYPEKQLMPVDGTAARAHYDEMCFFILSDLEQPLWIKGKHRMVLPEAYRVPEIIEKTTPFEFEKAQQALLTLKGDSSYAIGEQFTMADVLLTQTINWAEKFEFTVADELKAYRDKMVQRPAFLAAKGKLIQ